LDGTQIVAGGGTIGSPGTGWTYEGIGDFTGTGNNDILFQNTSGSYELWQVSGTQIELSDNIGSPGGSYSFKGIGDFTGDGKDSVLFEDASGNCATWDLSGTSIVGGGVTGNPGAGYSFAGITNLSGDGDTRQGILFTTASGQVASWQLNDTRSSAAAQYRQPRHPLDHHPQHRVTEERPVSRPVEPRSRETGRRNDTRRLCFRILVDVCQTPSPRLCLRARLRRWVPRPFRQLSCPACR
jgi:hypothetical protein